jgi:HPP family
MEWLSIASHYPGHHPVCDLHRARHRIAGSGAGATARLDRWSCRDSLVGLAVLQVTGAHAWAAAGVVGLAVLAMYVTGTFHPPAGINPLLVVSNNLPWSFLFVPVLAGAVLLTAFAYRWHRWDPSPALATARVVMPAVACVVVTTASRSCPGPAA